MKTPRITLKIENPCNENWSGMTEVQQGRFCSSCSKNVVDFSILSDKEIIKVIESLTGQLCGRLKKTQLNRVLINNTTPISYQVVYRLLTSLILIPVPALVLAYNKPNVEILSPMLADKMNDSLTSNDQDPKINQKLVFSGKVLGNDDHLPVLGATITIKGTGIKTTTDEDGNFSIRVPKDFKSRKVTFVISSIGYEVIERNIKREHLPRKETVILDSASMMLGGIAMIVD
jgi:hypothetical protein